MRFAGGPISAALKKINNFRMRLMKNLISILCLFFAASSAFAQAKLVIKSYPNGDRVEFQSNSGTTNNSRLTFEGLIPDGTKYIAYFIKKGTEDVTIQKFVLQNDNILPTANLIFGPGIYSIGVSYGSSLDSVGLPENVVRHDMKVVNTDPRNQYLLLSRFVNPEHPGVVELAKKIINGLNNDYDKALAIHDWVALEISYVPSDKLKDHTEVLKYRVGVCREYAQLYAALLRASGIPARVVSGMGFHNGKSGLHSWNEVFLKGRWIYVDTTWDSGPTDPITGKNNRNFSRSYFDADPVSFAKSHHRRSVE